VKSADRPKSWPKVERGPSLSERWAPHGRRNRRKPMHTDEARALDDGHTRSDAAAAQRDSLHDLGTPLTLASRAKKYTSGPDD